MKVAVVILNWNGKSFLERYLPSVLSACPDFADVIVADNGSEDGSLEVVAKMQREAPKRDGAGRDGTERGGAGREKTGREDSGRQAAEIDIAEINAAAANSVHAHASPEWIPLGKNWGFTGGYNRAFARIRESGRIYDYYILLNSDIMTPGGWIEPLVEFMESHPEAGICQPKILSLTEKNRFEYAGACGGFIDRFGFPFCRGRILSCTETDDGQYDTPLRVFWATGACMVVRAGLWHRLGGLEEKFFAHMEEIDFCWRAALSEYEIWCVPASRIYHLGGGTLPNNSPRKLYFNYRNNLLLLWRNLHPKGKRRSILLRKSIDLLTAAAYILQGKPGFAAAVMRAHRDFGRMKKDIAVSGRSARFEKPENRVWGIYPHSIILKYLTGIKKFSRLGF